MNERRNFENKLNFKLFVFNDIQFLKWERKTLFHSLEKEEDGEGWSGNYREIITSHAICGEDFWKRREVKGFKLQIYPQKTQKRKK